MKRTMKNVIGELLAEASDCIAWAEEQNVGQLARFITSNLELPLICIGSGGSFSICTLIAMMYDTLGGVAKAVTPYSVYSISDASLSRCKTLLVSTSGHNKDIVRIAKHLMKISPQYVANLTTSDSPKNDLKTIIPTERSFNFKSNITEGFIAVNSIMANYALAIKALKGKCRVDFSSEACNKDLSSVSHFVVLYGGWGQPAAVDIESKLVESGIATCSLSDYRNFCHGRFIFPGNHCGHEKKSIVADDSAVIMLTTPREKNFASKIHALLPQRCRVIDLDTAHSDSLAAIDLLFKTTSLFGDIAETHCINPVSPPNYGPIDKLKPQQIPFINDIKNAGPLTI